MSAVLTMLNHKSRSLCTVKTDAEVNKEADYCEHIILSWKTKTDPETNIN